MNKFKKTFFKFVGHLILGGWLLPLIAHAQGENGKFEIYTYHTDSPYVLDQEKKTGLLYDLAEEIKKVLKREPTISFFPRQRLDQLMLKADFDVVIVPWVDSTYFEVSKNVPHQWMEPLFNAPNALVSSVQAPLKWEGKETVLSHKTIGCIRGHKFSFLSDGLKYERINVAKDEQNFEKLLTTPPRIDAAMTNVVMANYYIKMKNLSDKLFISSIGNQNLRRLLIAGRNKTMVDDFAKRLSGLNKNPEWRKILSTQYGVSDFVD